MSGQAGAEPVPPGRSARESGRLPGPTESSSGSGAWPQYARPPGGPSSSHGRAPASSHGRIPPPRPRPSDRLVGQPPRPSDRLPAQAGRPPSGSGFPRVGPYELLGELGRGSSGTVYKARRPGIERVFALKLLPEDLDPEGRARLEREARVASRIEHPGVVPALDVGVHDNRLYLVMEHVAGETLQEHLARRRGPLPWREVRDQMVALAEAVQAAHDAGVVHRDLKPANVLLDARDGRPRVTDFGLARDEAAAHKLTREGDVIGTPYYMSPEQVQGRKVDPRTDVYALGVILYEMLSGKRPFVAQNVAGLVEKILGERVEPPRRLVPTIPPALDAACLKAMARDPAQRFGSARELVQALRAVADTGEAPRRQADWTLPVMAGLLLALCPPAALLTLRSRALDEVAATRQVVEREQSSRARLQEEAARKVAILRTEEEALKALRVQAPADDQRLLRLRVEQSEVMAWHVARDGHTARVLDRLAEELRVVDGGAALAAAILRNRGRYEEALELLDASSGAGDGDPELAACRFRTLSRLGRADEAKAALEPLLAREPADSPRAVWASVILERIPAAEALPALRRAGEAPGCPSYVHILRAMLCTRAGAHEEALAAATRAIEIEPASPDARLQRLAAVLELWLQRLPRAEELELVLRDARQAREVRPDVECWSLAGKAMLLADQPLAALSELEVAAARANEANDALALADALTWMAGSVLLFREEPGVRLPTPASLLERAAGKLEDDLRLAALVAPLADWMRGRDGKAHADLLAALPPGARARLEGRGR